MGYGNERIGFLYFESNQRIDTERSKSALFRELAKISLKYRSYLFSSNEKEIRSECLDFIRNSIFEFSVLIYLKKEFTNEHRTKTLIDRVLSYYRDKNLNLKSSIFSIVDQFLSDTLFIGSADQRNGIKIEIYKICEDWQSNTNEISAYYKVKNIRELLVKNEIISNMSDKMRVRRLLSELRILFLIHDAKSCSLNEYANIIKISKTLKEKDKNSKPDDKEDILNYIKNAVHKYYDPSYRIDNGHFDLFEDYSPLDVSDVVNLLLDEKKSFRKIQHYFLDYNA